MNSSNELLSRGEPGMHADRLSDESARTGDTRGLMPPGQGQKAADAAADVRRYAAVKASLESAGYTLLHTAQGIFIVARWNLSRTLANLDEAESFQRKVAP